MKKLTKLFSLLTVLVTILGPLGNIRHLVHADDAQPQQTKVFVHKILLNKEQFADFDHEAKKDGYNGNRIGTITDYFGSSAKDIGGVTFKVYKQVADTENGEGVVTGNSLLGLEDSDPNSDTKKYKLHTDSNKASITTVENTGAEVVLENGIYIFVEDKENSPYYNGQKELTGMKAVPFKLVLPQAKTDGTGYFDKKTPLHVYPKNTENQPTIDKTFGDGKKEQKDVNIGDTIEYKITTKVPKDAAYKTFAWEDTMVAGLDFTTGSLKITDNKNVGLQANTDYTLVETKRGFTVKLTNDGLAKLETAAKAGDVNFTLTYKATLNDSAAVDTAIPNKVKLIYGNRPSDFNEPKSTTPSNGQIIIEKTWGDGTTKKDVVFSIYEEETGKFIKKVTLTAGTPSVTVTDLEDKKYLVIEEHVAGSLPTYNNDTQGTIRVENKKNPNPNPLTPEDPKVITYGKRFVKTDDATEANSALKLTGAEFVVTNEQGQFLALKGADAQAEAIKEYKAAEEAYVTAVKNNVGDIETLKATRNAKYEAMNMQWEWVDGQDKAFTFVSSEDGKFEVKGLKAGNYSLVETKAPDGYALLTSAVPFVVAPNSWTTATDTPISEHQRVVNKKVTIPQTGGIGTLVFTVVGLSAMVFAFIAMKKRQSEEEA